MTEECEFCKFAGPPIKLKRQWVHYFPLKGQTFVCQAKGICPTKVQDESNNSV